MGTTTEPKVRRARGTGRMWKFGNIWWIQYYSRGKGIRESSHSTKEKDAEKLLRQRLAEVVTGTHRPAHRITYDEMRAAYFDHYVTNHRKSLRYAKDGTPRLDAVTRLDKFFEGYRADDIDTPLMRSFNKKLQAEGLTDGSIRNSLSALRRMFHLAKQDGKLRDIPYFPMPKGIAVRKGFFEPWQYVALRDALPDYLRGPFTIAYHTGMRREEILSLRWDQVDFMNKVIHLHAGETKNDEARDVPIGTELCAVLQQQFARRASGCDLVCFRLNLKNKVVRIGDFRKVWYDRCVKLGLGKMVEKRHRFTGEVLYDKPRGPRSKPKAKMIYKGVVFHNLRNTFVTDAEHGGAPRHEVMAITGHKTESIYKHYAIEKPERARAALRDIDAYRANRKPEVGASSGQIETVAPASQSLPN